jgi:hypothetical protein
MSEALTGPKPRKHKTQQERAKEAAILLAWRDPFEDWRRNMVSEKKLTHFQRQLRSNEGLSTLQGELKGEAQKFKNFWLKEISPEHLYEDRMKFGPHAMKTAQAVDKKEASQNMGLTLTEEAQQRGSTKENLFKYFKTPLPTGEQPSMGTLAKLMEKSHSHGANLNKLAKDEERRQLEERRRLRAEKLKNDGRFSYKKDKRKEQGSPSPTTEEPKAKTMH